MVGTFVRTSKWAFAVWMAWTSYPKRNSGQNPKT